MLSSLPKINDKAFFIGYLFPVLLFSLTLLMLLQAFFKKIGIDPSVDIEKIEKLIFVTFYIWAFSIFLMLSNTILFRAIEGYSLPFGIYFLRCREVTRFKIKKARYEELFTEWREQRNAFPERLQRECRRLSRELASDFPSDEDSILPTRFGNVIRSFEDYPRYVYGADSIPLWIHLISVIPKDFFGIIEDARTQVICLLNIFWLSWAMLIISTILFFSELYAEVMGTVLPFAFDGYERPGAIAISSIALVTLSYWLMLERARNWGECVKAAFDCFLPELGSKLGFELPSDPRKQREFWVSVSRRALFNSPIPAHYYKAQRQSRMALD
jgi:hypothetical protein